VVLEPEIKDFFEERLLIVLQRSLVVELKIVISESREHNGVRQVLGRKDTEILMNLQ
jgi:hypothetical protein